MVDYKLATLDDIINDAVKLKRTRKLKEIAAKVDENGKKISFLQLKREYYMEFYSDLVPVAKPKSLTMWERIADL